MSTSTCSSPRTSWTSELDLPGEVNTWNDALDAAHHYDTGDSNLVDLPFREDVSSHLTDAGDAYQFFSSGTDPERLGDGGVRKRSGIYMDDNGLWRLSSWML